MTVAFDGDHDAIDVISGSHPLFANLFLTKYLDVVLLFDILWVSYLI